MENVVSLLELLLTGLIFAIFARSLISWFPVDRNGPIFQALDGITEPILDPLRRLIPTIGAIDITPMVAILILYAIRTGLTRGSF